MRALKVVFEDLGADLPGRTSFLLALNNLFDSIHVPLWSLAVVGLAVDLGVWWRLRQKGRFEAAGNWLWLVTAAVMPTTVMLLDFLIAPFTAPLINSCFR